MITKAHAIEAGCPEDLADFIDAYPVEPWVWAELVAFAALRGEIVWQIIAADLAVGKDWNAVLSELSLLPHRTGRMQAMLTSAHATKCTCPCPPDLAAQIDADPRAIAVPGLWATLIALALQYGPQVWVIVSKDLAAGKGWQVILTDLFGIVFPTVPPVPTP